MSQEERDWLEWLKRAKGDVITQRQAAAKMGVSDRWVRKLLARMKTDGDAVVVHGRRDRSSNRRIEEQTQARVVELLKQPEWYDFGPTFASEQLSSGTTSASARRRCADGWWRQGYGRRSRASSARRISGDRGGADTASWCSGTRPLTTGWRGEATYATW